jgi:hypothetical protein
VTRLIRAELDRVAEPEKEGSPDDIRPNDSPPLREQPFLRPVVRLATFPSFNVLQVIASIPTQERAATTYRICEELIGSVAVGARVFAGQLSWRHDEAKYHEQPLVNRTDEGAPR